MDKRVEKFFETQKSQRPTSFWVGKLNLMVMIIYDFYISQFIIEKSGVNFGSFSFLSPSLVILIFSLKK